MIALVPASYVLLRGTQDGVEPVDEASGGEAPDDVADYEDAEVLESPRS